MKVNDLRIGNLVKAAKHPKDSVFEIYRIYETSVTALKSDRLYGFDIDELEPIQLTEEKLLKFGYLPCEFTENHFTIVGHRIWKCNDVFLCDKNGVIIDHAHQLQNLYYALTRGELTFKI